ncbi:sporulation integral membrane protein YtvI [Robertmurraya sp. FSL R5-0851]|uniref:sporulation integral membrane protein YtvI n=1 Tax=Robertmurraya sp. FSL R5-0851 TaxID=2921584 RepID=UPI0030F7A178
MLKKLIIVIVLCSIGFFLLPYSLPLVFALVTALFLEGLVEFYKNKLRIARVHAVLASFLTYILGLVIIGYHFFTLIIQQTLRLSESTPTFVKDFYRSTILPIMGSLERYLQTLPEEVLNSMENTIESSIASLDAFLQTLFETIISLLTAIPGFLIEFLVYLVALFLFSLELPRLKENIKRHLTEGSLKKASLVINQLTWAGVGFIKAQLFLSVITFVMAFTGLWILGVTNKTLLSLLIVIVDILPILGTGSVLVPWGIVAILQENQLLGVGLIILFGLITIIRRIIEPKVYSSSLGISPLASLVSLYIGFKLIGFLGLFLGPAIVIVYDTLKKANVIKVNYKI